MVRAKTAAPFADRSNFQFPRTKDPLDFAGMGIEIDVEKQRQNWAVTFTAMQTALRFCNFDHVEAEETVGKFSEEDGFIDETGSRWADSIDYLEAGVEAMKEACRRLAICQDRVIAAPKTGKAKPSAMLAEYSAIKAENPDVLLFYRMGQFYELFFEDAEIAAKALGIVLKQRGKHEGRDVAMCSVPVGRHEECLNELIRQGHRVALCDEVAPEARARGGEFPHSRGVWRLASPGRTDD